MTEKKTLSEKPRIIKELRSGNKAKKTKSFTLKAKRPKGFEDQTGAVLKSELQLVETARFIYEQHGFIPLQTPAFEYADLIGKFLPDEDRPNEGVFALEDEDRNWLALRYDLTAPLARYVAENFESLAKPYRRYQTGRVWRNEKPGPGRFREFTQCDADSIGVADVTADSEMVMMAAKVMEAVGNSRGDFCINVNDRRLLDSIFETLQSTGNTEEQAFLRSNVLRAIDKRERLGLEGVAQLLGEGRKDESGDYTEGVNLSARDIQRVLDFIQNRHESRADCLAQLEKTIGISENAGRALSDLKRMDTLLSKCGYESDRIRFDFSIVRGLDYYTGMVFEADMLIETQNEKGQAVRVGSVGGGGRYDGLVKRFRGISVPGTGFSFGVSRFATVLRLLKRQKQEEANSLVILVLDPEDMAYYFQLAEQARKAGLIAEVYLGGSGIRAQMKYADKKGARFAVLIGEEERSQGKITLKDLQQGRALSKEILDREVWQKDRPAQKTVMAEHWIQHLKNWGMKHE